LLAVAVGKGITPVRAVRAGIEQVVAPLAAGLRQKMVSVWRLAFTL